MPQHINGTLVPDAMYSEVVGRSRQGAKMFLVIPEAAELDQVRSDLPPCPNCQGSGKVGFQLLVSGPHEKPHTMVGFGCIWHNGQWFNAKTTLGTCPVCNGTKRSKK